MAPWEGSGRVVGLRAVGGGEGRTADKEIESRVTRFAVCVRRGKLARQFTKIE